MQQTPLLLAGLAVILAGPVPALVTRTPRLRCTPVAAMLLWQSIALAAVLAALGAGLALATTRSWGTVASLSLVVTAVVAIRLGWTGHLVGTTLRTHRQHHREQLDLIANHQAGLTVLDTVTPLAYCIPSRGSSRVVVSQGALDHLSDEELTAVLAHEHAHLKSRHDLVVEAFTVLRQAFPRRLSSAAALREVRLLVEVLADRRAAREVGAIPLGRALASMVDAATPRIGLAAGAGTAELVARIDLLRCGPHRAQALAVSLTAVGVLALPTGFVVAPWLISLG